MIMVLCMFVSSLIIEFRFFDFLCNHACTLLVGCYANNILCIFFADLCIIIIYS